MSYFRLGIQRPLRKRGMGTTPKRETCPQSIRLWKRGTHMPYSYCCGQPRVGQSSERVKAQALIAGLDLDPQKEDQHDS